ncbi:MAG: hypothetical protein U1G07_16485 [Verrucomicrobiota bacterium]
MKRTTEAGSTIGLMGLLFIASCNRALAETVSRLTGLVRIGDAIITEQAFKTLLDQRAQNHPGTICDLRAKRALPRN